MKRTPLKRKPWRKALGTAEQRFAFKRAVLSADGNCVMVGQSFCDGPLQAAHVVRKHTLRKLGFGAEVVYHVDAAMTLCQRHHWRHDTAAERVPYALVPERCKDFVTRIGLMHLLNATKGAA